MKPSKETMNMKKVGNRIVDMRFKGYECYCIIVMDEDGKFISKNYFTTYAVCYKNYELYK
jgi:hypothetical protein